MSAAIHHQLHKRIASGSAFALAFGIVAAVIVIACVVWGVLVPEYRRKFSIRRSSASWSDGSTLTTRTHRKLRKTYPAHPAVRPLLNKPLPAQILPTCNPRTESPFPTRSTDSTSGDDPTDDSRARSTPLPPTTISSNGLFTPVRWSCAGDDESKSKYYTVPRASDAKHLAAKSSDFGDAKDFILAVPEPLALKSRDAGRPLAINRHLQKHALGFSASPANSDKLLHPNKLFRAVQGADSRNSICSSTSMRVDHRQSDINNTLRATDVVEIVNKAIEEATPDTNDVESANTKENKTPDLHPSKRNDAQNELTAVHRLRSYHSLTGGRQSKLTRAGTLTRPKTPVDELRKFYNQQQRLATEPMLRLPTTGTTSTLLDSTGGCSDHGSISTPATSPALPPNNLKLLPRPLCPKRSFEPGSVRSSGISSPCTIGSTVFGYEVKDDTFSLEVDDAQERVGKGSRGFYHTGRRLTKPAPLQIRSGGRTSPSNLRRSHQSFTEFSRAAFSPLIRSNGMRARARASSMYSRDTHGFSMVNTPVTPDFPTPASEIFIDRHDAGNLFKSESVGTRVHEWTQRARGDVVSQLRHPHASAMSEVALSWKVDPVEVEDTHPTTTSRAYDGETDTVSDGRSAGKISKSAPGGADWI